MSDLICDVISCCVLSYDTGKINVYGKIVIENQNKIWKSKKYISTDVTFESFQILTRNLCNCYVNNSSTRLSHCRYHMTSAVRVIHKVTLHETFVAKTNTPRLSCVLVITNALYSTYRTTSSASFTADSNTVLTRP